MKTEQFPCHNDDTFVRSMSTMFREFHTKIDIGVMDARIREIIRTIPCPSMRRCILYKEGLFDRYYDNLDEFHELYRRKVRSEDGFYAVQMANVVTENCKAELSAKDDKITDAVEILHRRYIKGDADREASVRVERDRIERQQLMLLEECQKYKGDVKCYYQGKGGWVLYSPSVREEDKPHNYYSVHRYVMVSLFILGVVGLFNFCAAVCRM